MDGLKNAPLKNTDGEPIPEDMEEGRREAMSRVAQLVTDAKSIGSDQYLHLRNVAVLNVTKLATFPSWWRVRMDSIGAWALGHSASKL
jgi:hypothetical protein